MLKLDQFINSSSANRFDLLNQSISHAKHAIRIERHQFGLTTLGKILFEEMKHSDARFLSAFREAFVYLDEAITLEGRMNRIAIHPYMTMFGGTNHYLKQGGKLSNKEEDRIKRHLDNAEKFFSYDSSLMILGNEVRARIEGA